MGKTNISWTDFSWNPWIGCTRVSPGCQFCYADTQDKLRKWTPEGWGKGKPRKRTSESNWKLPLKWNREYDIALERRDEAMLIAPPESVLPPYPYRPRIFCASLADWLDDEVPVEWLADLLKLIHDTPNLDWQLLTKRPENWKPRMEEVIDWCLKQFSSLDSDVRARAQEIHNFTENWIVGTQIVPSGIPENVWIGTSVENQDYDWRIKEALKIPAKIHFLSMEPLLGPVELKLSLEEWSKLHWVIVGGESGGKRREMKLEWAESLRDQCQAAGVAFFFKQVSAFKPGCLDGVPVDLLKQEFPK